MSESSSNKVLSSFHQKIEIYVQKNKIPIKITQSSIEETRFSVDRDLVSSAIDCVISTRIQLISMGILIFLDGNFNFLDKFCFKFQIRISIGCLCYRRWGTFAQLRVRYLEKRTSKKINTSIMRNNRNQSVAHLLYVFYLQTFCQHLHFSLHNCR